MIELMLRREFGLPMLFGSILLAVPMAVLATALIARAFRRRVAGIMRELSSEPEPGAGTGEPPVVELAPQSISSAPVEEWRRRASLSYVVAASVFALVATVCHYYGYPRSTLSLTPRGLLLGFGVFMVFATPLPLGYVALTSRRFSAVVGATALWLCVLIAIGAACGDATGLIQVWTTWSLVPTLLVGAFAWRRIRAGGPTLLAAFWLLALAAQVGLVVSIDLVRGYVDLHFTRADLMALPFEKALVEWLSEGLSAPLTQVGLLTSGQQSILAVRHPERATTVLWLMVVAWVAFLLIALLPIAALLIWQARRYRNRHTSELQLAADTTFMLFGLSWSAIACLTQTVSAWVAVLIALAFPLYLGSTHSLSRTPSESSQPSSTASGASVNVQRQGDKA